MSGHVIAYAGYLNFDHNIFAFSQECPILFKKAKEKRGIKQYYA